MNGDCGRSPLRRAAYNGLVLEAVEAQTGLASARLGLVRTVIGYNLCQVRLVAAVGHLTPDALGGSTE